MFPLLLPCSPRVTQVNATSRAVLLLLQGPTTSGVRSREPRACAAQALRVEPQQQCWASESQCGHHCLAALLPGQPDQSADEALPRLQKDTSGPYLWLEIPSSATPLLLSRICSSTASRAGFKPSIQQIHSVLEFHLVPTYFWGIVALDLAGCEVQKDTDILTMEGKRPGRGMAASSSVPGNAYTEVHSHCCGGPNAL